MAVDPDIEDRLAEVVAGDNARAAALQARINALAAGIAAREGDTPDDPVELGDRPSGTLAYGVSGITDWGNPVFIDIMKSCRRFAAENMSHEQLEAAGLLDAHGYPTAIPAGSRHVGTIWDWGAYPYARSAHVGRWVLTYDGEGDFLFHLGSTVVSREPGRVVLDLNGGTFAFLVTRMTAGNHPRNMRLVREDHLDLAAAERLFHPDWLAIVSKAQAVRFMPWMNPNGHGWDGSAAFPYTFPEWMSDWSKRAEPGDAGGYDAKGVPVEYMVALANEANFDPWFNLPHLSDKHWVQSFGRYVRDNLNTHLRVRFARSNEWWNWAFAVTHWLNKQAKDNWGPNASWHEYGVMQATKQAVWLNEVWAERDGPKPELIHVLEGMQGNDWLTNEYLNPKVWPAREPDQYVDPKTVFHEFGVTSYFGGMVIMQDELRAELLRRITADPAAARRWFRDGMINGTLPDGPHHIVSQTQKIKAVVGNMRVVSYEGGSHTHHSFATGIPEGDLNQLQPWLSEFSYSDEMGEIYEAWAEAWESVGEGPHMQFVEVSEPGWHGSWGARRGFNDNNPRALACDALADHPVWWE